MTRLSITAAAADDMRDLAARMSLEDAAELAAAGLTLEQALADTQQQALRWGDQLVCLFGVVAHPESPATGIPWMLCTNTLPTVPRRAMARISAQVVAIWRGEFLALRNLVHRHNRRAISFVRWLGFTVVERPAGPGAEFFVFEWERPNV